ncbi:MAG TPA: hypothetical protein VIV15_16140 [Anaerolineales bacterium]
MQNGISYLAYEDLILKGWFISQYHDLAHDLEVLERYGHLEHEQRRKLLRLAREIQGSNPAEEISQPRQGRPASHKSPTQLIR